MPISATGPTNSRRGAGAAPRRRSADHGFAPRRRSAEHGFAPRWRSAEHGFTPPRRSAEHGFTLVELMVVVAILALAAGAVAWSWPDPAGRVRDEAARFALRARAAHDAAITGARPVALWVGAAGYGFDGRVAGGWQPLPRPLGVERWQAGTAATLGEAAATARVVFDATGLADRPLELTLRRRAARARVRVGADGGVAVDG